MKRIFFCLIIALATLTVRSQLPLMQGRVVRVLDGDTFELLQTGDATGAQRIRCRIVEIDAPERDQSFGRELGDSLRALLLNQCVTCRPIAHDQYHRWLVKVTHLNYHPLALDSILVSRGWAWSVRGWNTKGYQANADPVQADARWFDRGLWKCPYPVPPWIWRRFKAPVKRLYQCQ